MEKDAKTTSFDDSMCKIVEKLLVRRNPHTGVLEPSSDGLEWRSRRSPQANNKQRKAS
jgi:hypothetical protein